MSMSLRSQVTLSNLKTTYLGGKAYLALPDTMLFPVYVNNSRLICF